MSQSGTVTKKVRDLKKGDIIDISPFALGFGWRYHKIVSDPRKSESYPKKHSFDLSVFGMSAVKVKRRDYFGWPIKIDSDADVEVCIGEPVQVRQPDSDEE